MNNSTIIGKKNFNFIENRQDLTHLGDLETWLIEFLPQLSTSPQQLRKSLRSNDLRLRIVQQTIRNSPHTLRSTFLRFLPIVAKKN